MTARLRIGNIIYSNCFPVHSRLIDQPREDDPILVNGIPSELNGLLAAGEIDVSPSSSIEYARHANDYRILPDLVIGSRGAVRSILLVSDLAPTEFGGKTIALPTASATSVVLLKILLRVRWNIHAEFVWFDQSRDDPFAMGASAALFIGDVALRPQLYPEKRVRLDLGEEWWDETGLPFAFAVWQATGGTDQELTELHGRLKESRSYARANSEGLAAKYAQHFAIPADLLHDYWHALSFTLDEAMREGLERYYSLAAEVGEIRRAPAIRWL